ncbi:MAG: class I SAM-dependent methyltransferase [Anaerolineales bacterium]|nr:class I SAM-dependent methyltransferase [Anaerolineales bacterium]
MTLAPDLQRLQREYSNRSLRLASSDRYSLANPGHLFEVQNRQRALLELFSKTGSPRLAGRRILEVGCAGGAVLREWLYLGAEPSRLHGCELIFERAAQALPRLPLSAITCADGQHLPYPPAAFDLVLQYTVFSSVLDPAVRRRLAAEMLRVLKPGGTIIWYDYWLNPTNPQARGVRLAEIRALFPNCAFDFVRITLAPPVARLIARRSWWLCHLLEALKIFNTHYLVAIRPSGPGDFL